MLSTALEEGLSPAHDVLNGPCMEGGAQFVLEFLHRKNYIEYSNNTHTPSYQRLLGLALVELDASVMQLLMGQDALL